MKLLQKLLLGFLGNSILLGFIGTVAISTNLHNKHYATQFSKSSVKEFEAATQMNYALAAIQVNAHKLLFKDYSIAKSNNTNSTAKTAKIEIEYELNKFEEYLDYSKKATRSAIVLAQRNGFF